MVGHYTGAAVTDFPIVQAILVCQGAEFAAVRRGLRTVQGPKPIVLPMPIGPVPVREYLKTCQQEGRLSHSPVLVMGLCGSLIPRYAVGDAVLYQSCTNLSQSQMCDRSLTDQLASQLSATLPDNFQGWRNGERLVKAITSDRILCSASEKQSLATTQGVDVVDMEGCIVLEMLHQLGIVVAMLRVVSDDCHHDLPNLAPALDASGTLRPLPLAIALMRQPIAAARFIQGSLRGLKTLQMLTTALFSG